MKTLVALLLVLLLSGCAAASVAQPSAPAAPQEVPEESVSSEPAAPVVVPELPEEIQYHVEMTHWSDETRAEDGAVLVSYAMDLPVLTPIREDGTAIKEAKTEAEEKALAIAETFNQGFVNWTDTTALEWANEAATEDYAWRQEEGIPWHDGYALDLSCTAYQTEHMISVSACYYSYTGGAHPNTAFLGWNFDLETGTFLDAKMLGNEEFAAAVTEELIRQANVWAEESELQLEELYWEDYASIMADWSNYAVAFDEAGMTITFSAYELAPYAAGPQVFRIPYDWMRPYLNQQGNALLGLDAT